jgi:hypothetical protein
VLGAGEYVEVIVAGEVRPEHQEAGEVELAGGDGLEERNEVTLLLRYGVFLIK